MELFIKLVLSILFVAAFVTLNFAIFKLPIKGNDKQIATLALVVGAVNFYFKFVVDSQYFFLIQTLTYIIILSSLRRYPLLFSCIVVLGGSVAGSFLDVGVSFAAVGLNLSSIELMVNNLTHFTVFHLAQTFVYFIISYLLVKFKIGFKLIAYKYKFYVLEKFNVLWMLLVISVTAVLIYSSQNFHTSSLHAYILALITLGLIIFLTYGYSQNKKDQQSRRDVLKK
ncbi:hypothetical protein ACFPES_03125 [Paenibacillus sp. GCM10023248]|uniref:hypothetical protein n=1 Tax=unclassified Paenibacillus TaxID=185978 RepID=UPI0023784956|nr:hypothetical protein [Paenibacillus sp. MAHUQ-63]MDD9266017.1 hypothetical protein [Paenibacillus sp. MAHUQ-63]